MRTLLLLLLALPAKAQVTSSLALPATGYAVYQSSANAQLLLLPYGEMNFPAGENATITCNGPMSKKYGGDFIGVMSIGSTTSCTVTFSRACSTIPECRVVSSNGSVTTTVTPTLTGFSVTFSPALTGGMFWYCPCSR